MQNNLSFKPDHEHCILILLMMVIIAYVLSGCATLRRAPVFPLKVVAIEAGHPSTGKRFTYLLEDQRGKSFFRHENQEWKVYQSINEDETFKQ